MTHVESCVAFSAGTTVRLKFCGIMKRYNCSQKTCDIFIHDVTFWLNILLRTTQFPFTKKFYQNSNITGPNYCLFYWLILTGRHDSCLFSFYLILKF